MFGAGRLDPILSGAMFDHLAAVELRAHVTLDHIGKDYTCMVVLAALAPGARSTSTAVRLCPG